MNIDSILTFYSDTIEINHRWSRPPFNDRKISHLKSHLEHKEFKYLVWIESNLYFKTLVEHYQKAQVVVVAKVYDSDFRLIHKSKARRNGSGFLFTSYDSDDLDNIDGYYQLTRSKYLGLLCKALESVKFN